jgi:uncharacterized protein
VLKFVQSAWANLFGVSGNDRYAASLRQISKIGLECSAHFRATQGKDVAGTIAFEHKADRVVDEVHELLDNSFIMRFDIPDAMRLTDELDDVIDGMRKVALHIDAYQKFLGQMRPEAIELMSLGGDMLLLLAKVRDVANKIDEMESHADKIVAVHERKLVEEFSAPGAVGLGFVAWHQLFHLLEQITDDANHCAGLILSLARKEA